jgi:hypothetical protein
LGGLTRGEILLVVFIFGLVYVAGLLPKIAARLAPNDAGAGKTPAKAEDE